MLRRPVFFLFSLAVLLAAAPLRSPAAAQGAIQAWTHYALPVYSGPERSQVIIGVLTPRAEVLLEARNFDARWVLGHTPDGKMRGWMESQFLEIAVDLDVTRLLVTSEQMYVHYLDPVVELYDIDLNAYSVVPTASKHAREIFLRGQATGNNPHVLSKVGDCITDNEHFLSPFGLGKYNLGTFPQLQAVIDQYGDSLAYTSLAAYNGLVTSAVLDPLFANPDVCQVGESPLRCEYRVHKPSVAIIMFGAQDLLFVLPDQFEDNLQRIVHETIEAGVVPILSTFPGNTEIWDASILYNQIVIRVALDYDVPLMNLWRALEALPNHGLNTDGRHLSLPITDSGDLSGSNLRRGYPLRNLVTLQALDAVWRGLTG